MEIGLAPCCPVCSGTGRLLGDSCPLCEDSNDSDSEEIRVHGRRAAAAEGTAATADATSEGTAVSGTAPPEPVDWMRRCRRCRPNHLGRQGAKLLTTVHARSRCQDCDGIGRARLSLRPSPNVMDDGLVNLDGLARRLARGEFQDIIVCTGAGISVNSGISDFRSPGGLFDQIRAELGANFPEVAEQPEVALSRRFASEHPVEHRRILDRMEVTCANARPSTAHLLLALLARRGWLRRVYTQNVDGLHRRAGVSTDQIVEAHGSHENDNLVLYGDDLADDFYASVKEDFPRDSSRDRCDFMLVLGTALQVAPFCAVPNLVRRDVPRALVTLRAHECYTNGFTPQRIDSYKVTCASTMSFGRRKVTMKPQWGPHWIGPGSSKYREQWVFDEDTDAWTGRLAAAAGWAVELAALRADSWQNIDNVGQ